MDGEKVDWSDDVIETSFRMNEEGFRSLTEDLPAMVCSYLPDSTLVYVNQAYCDYHQMSREELVGRQFIDFIPEEHRASAQQTYLSLKPERPLNIHTHFVYQKGTKRWQEWRDRAFFDKDGVAIRYQAIGIDVTEQVETQDKLRKKQTILAELLRISHEMYRMSLDSLILTTIDFAEQQTESAIAFYHFVENDQSTIKLQSWSSKTRTGMCQARGAGVHYPVGDAGIWADCIRQKEVVIINDYTSSRKKNSLPEGHVPLRRFISLPVIRDNQVKAVIGVGNKEDAYTEDDVEILTEISETLWNYIEYKRADEALMANHRQLADAKKAADEANAAKSQFLAHMSHEIRTPLNGVLGMLQLLKMDGLNGEQREHVALAESSAHNLMQLINQVLDFSKVEAGKVQLEEQEFHLHQLLKDVDSVYCTLAQQRKLSFNVNLAPEVPSHIKGDPFRLKQVLSNLIGNALKFTHTGGIELSVAGGGSMPGPHGNQQLLRWQVSDTGIGIPKNQQTHIFKSFIQADSAVTRKYGGTGLGLSISKAIVEQMGGEIWVSSCVGKGSQFHFTTPVHVVDKQDGYSNVSGSRDE